MQIVSENLEPKIIVRDWLDIYSGCNNGMIYDVCEGMIYDTVCLSAGQMMTPQAFCFFTNVGPASGKTYAQTNMHQSRFLPAPTAMLAKQINFVIHPSVNPRDLEEIQSNFAWEFWMGDKVFGRGPMIAAAALADVKLNEDKHIALPPPASGPDLSVLELPELRARAEYLGAPGGLQIENQMNFYALLNGTPTTLSRRGSGIEITCILRGLIARGVQ